jgi:hypothetical protein
LWISSGSYRSSFQPLKLAVCAIVGTCVAAAQANTGVHPRATPGDYDAAQQGKTVTYAASVLSADQVKHIFSIDISKSYLVFEVACYPLRSGQTSVDPDDFLIRAGKKSEFVHPADAVTVASVIQQKNTPRPASNGSAVYTSANVGYESGTDPYTGRRVHGVYSGAGVGVGPPDSAPPLPPSPGSTPQDRAILESQLSDKALPQGSFTAPVAGFLYFTLKAIKKKSSGIYELDYLGGASGKVQLQVPVKSR